MTVRGVILAAGLSRRMGAVKQLLPLRGRPLLQHVIDAARASRLEHVLLVLGHAHEEIRAKIDTHGMDVIVNPDYAAGQSTSVRLGVKHGPDTDGVMFLLGDQPLVGADLINALLAHFLAARPMAILPFYQGRRGNPAVIDRGLLAEISTLTGDIGARHVLQKHARHVLEMEVADAAVLQDVDTMADYLSLTALGRQEANLFHQTSTRRRT